MVRWIAPNRAPRLLQSSLVTSIHVDRDQLPCFAPTESLVACACPRGLQARGSLSESAASAQAGAASAVADAALAWPVAGGAPIRIRGIPTALRRERTHLAGDFTGSAFRACLFGVAPVDGDHSLEGVGADRTFVFVKWHGRAPVVSNSTALALASSIAERQREERGSIGSPRYPRKQLASRSIDFMATLRILACPKD